MKPSQLQAALTDLHAANIPAFIWGPAGIGKSDIVRQTAAALGVPVVDYRLYLREQVDVMGLPGIENGITVYAKPAELPHDPKWRGIIFFDEFCIASPSQQSPGMQLFLDRACGGYKLPAGAFPIAASNRQADRGLFHRLADPMADRVVHLELQADFEDWCAWAQTQAVAPEVIAFIRFRPDLLHSYDAQRKWPSPTSPRGWADVGKIIARRSVVEGDLIKGRVGESAGGEFISFLKLCREMVSPDEVIKNPKKADVPENGSVTYALVEALARRANPANWDAVMTYAKRLRKEYGQCLVSRAIKVTPALIETKQYVDWVTKNG